jgi:hypothetical protein
LLPSRRKGEEAQQTKHRQRTVEAAAMPAADRLPAIAVRRQTAMALSASRSMGSTISTRSPAPALARRHFSGPAGAAAAATAGAASAASAAAAAALTAPALATGLQHEAQAQLALNELFPHLRQASDAALRDIFVSLRVPARPCADA